MRAIQVTEFGGPDVLKLADVERPLPGPGQALIRIKAAGVNFADVRMRLGKIGGDIPLPFTPGLEAAGVVEALGNEAHDIELGDRVTYCIVPGSYAEYQVVDASRLVPLPDDISFDQAAAAILQGLTAHYLLYDVHPITPGTNVLVHAAAGGTGLVLMQWLKRLGARVIGTVSTEEKAAIATEAGADDVILYTQDFAAEAQKLTDGVGVDYIIDGVGLTTFLGNLDAVRIRGTICTFGEASGSPEAFVPKLLRAKSITLTGGMMLNYLRTREEWLRRSADVFSGVREGWLKLNIDCQLPLAQAAEAHRRLEERRSTGKVLLNI
jgi:NADPH2:quinone reductase